VSANFSFAPSYRPEGIPDPEVRPDLFDGVLSRRVFAYCIDLFCIGAVWVALWIGFAIVTVLSFGLLGPVLWFVLGLVPLAYHTLLLSGPHSATWGMRCFDLQLRAWTGERPGFLQALAQTALFYLTVGPTMMLVLLFVLFNRRKRTLHDVLAGTVMVRAHPMRWPNRG